MFPCCINPLTAAVCLAVADLGHSGNTFSEPCNRRMGPCVELRGADSLGQRHPSLDAPGPSAPGPWTRTVTPTRSGGVSPGPSSPCGAVCPPAGPPPSGPPPLDRAEVAMVTSGAMTSGGGLGVTPLHYKPFSSHAHYQQVMCALGKLKESGFYWGPVSGRDAGALLRAEPPGPSSSGTPPTTTTSSPCPQDEGFFLQRDPQSSQDPPRFDCVLKLIAHYMGKSGAAGVDGANPGNGRHVYLIHSGGEKVPLELRRPLCASMSSLQHLCRRTLNSVSLGARADRRQQQEQIPHTLKDFMDEYDAPI
ncbi:hypothetical protein WMY93_032096 [Mugilogobius chulae]|uniref:SOCS box domain-containing protein n=1 Tax=Mugilogobius chulae TaxID=88201 RepID=A0AAW0MKD0_9GOBI